MRSFTKGLQILFVVLLATNTIKSQDVEEQKIFMHVEQMPEFIGGETALIHFIEANLMYPEQERKEMIQGKVFCSFIVDAFGKVTSPKILRGITNHPNFDAEVMALLNKMPSWNPGKQNGKAVPVQFSLPINFLLPKK